MTKAQEQHARPIQHCASPKFVANLINSFFPNCVYIACDRQKWPIGAVVKEGLKIRHNVPNARHHCDVFFGAVLFTR